MNEKVNAILLVLVVGLLIFLAVRPESRLGRFQPTGTLTDEAGGSDDF